MNTATKTLLSRTSEISSTRLEALNKLNSYSFKPGEFVVAPYNDGRNISVILAVGIQNGGYNVLSYFQHQEVLGVSETEPREQEKEGYLWKNTSGDWYLGNEPLTDLPGIIINDLSSSTFYTVKDGIPQQLNNVYSEEEIKSLISGTTVKRLQSDWDSVDTLSLSFIWNKPIDLSSFNEDIRYTLVDGDLLKNGELIEESDKVIIPEDTYITSGLIVQKDNTLYLDIAFSNDTHIETPLTILTDIYTPGLGINIDQELKEITLNVREENGLTVTDEKGLTITPASETSAGYMSKEDKIALDSVDESILVTEAGLLNGDIEPKISKLSKSIYSSPLDARNLTTAPGYSFRSAAYLGKNIKTGPAELIEIQGNSTTPFNPAYFLSTGNNLANPKIILENRKISSTGNVIVDQNCSIIYFLRIPGETYTVSGEDIVVGYSYEKPQDSTRFLLTPDEDYTWIGIAVERGREKTVCARIDGKTEFEEYQETRIELKKDPSDTWGTIKINDIADRWYNYQGKLWFERNFGRRLLTISDWGPLLNKDGNYYYEVTISDIKPGTQYISGIEGVRVEEYKLQCQVISDTSLPSTGILYYQLNNPVTYQTDISSVYYVGDCGSERFLDSSDNIYPITSSSITSKYIPDLFNDLRTLEYRLSQKLNKADTDTEMSDTSTNVVQGKVVKEYIDEKVRGIENIYRDLSYIDSFGNELETMNTANCYVISEPGFYKLPLVYGNGIKNGAPNSDSYTALSGDYMIDFTNYLGNKIVSPYITTDTGKTPVSPTMLWEDAKDMIGNMDISNGYLRFSVYKIPGYGGNALIGIKDSEGIVMWSWHIWLYPDSLTPVSIWNNIPKSGPTGGTEYKAMPVNLGTVWLDYTKFKFVNPHYQWGRKDPMPRPKDNSGVESILYNQQEGAFGNFGSGDDKTIMNSIRMPNKFFPEYDASNRNWMAPFTSTSRQENRAAAYNLWDTKGTVGTGDVVTVKTIYDPCPYGWKVPNGAAFKGFTTTRGNTIIISEFNVIGEFNNGWTFKRMYDDPAGLFFPASGYRSRGSGGLADVSSSGNCWSSASGNQSFAYSFSFISGGVSPVYSSSRASGFSVRPFLE